MPAEMRIETENPRISGSCRRRYRRGTWPMREIGRAPPQGRGLLSEGIVDLVRYSAASAGANVDR